MRLFPKDSIYSVDPCLESPRITFTPSAFWEEQNFYTFEVFEGMNNHNTRSLG